MSDFDSQIRESLARRVNESSSTGPLRTDDLERRARRQHRNRRALQGSGAAIASLTVAAIIVTAAQFGGRQGGPGPAADASASSSPATQAQSPTQNVAPSEATENEAILRQLQASIDVSQQFFSTAHTGKVVLCGLKRLGSGIPDNGRLYVWLYCGTYDTGGAARNISAGTDAAVLTVKGAGAAVTVTKTQFPLMKTYQQDLRRLFPPQIVSQVESRHGLDYSPSETELLAAAAHLR